MAKPVIAVVFGTRPEAIKLAPVIEGLRAFGDVETRIVATAQHRDLLDQMLGVFKLEPDADLDLMRPGQSLDDVTARVVTGAGEVFDAMKPALVLVQGDTTTVFASSLAAFRLIKASFCLQVNMVRTDSSRAYSFTSSGRTRCAQCFLGSE